MGKFIKTLTNEEIELLTKIKPSFKRMKTENLWLWLMNYLQTHGLYDIDDKLDLKIID